MNECGSTTENNSYGAMATDRKNLLSKIAAQGARPGDIVVSLEDFFTGNDDRGSIGCNLGEEQPPIETFFQVSRDIRSRPGVQDLSRARVRVR